MNIFFRFLFHFSVVRDKQGFYRLFIFSWSPTNLRIIFLLLLLGNSGSILITNLTLDSNKVGDSSRGITKGSNKELIPEGGTIHTVVEQADAHVISLLNGITNVLNSLGISFGTLQETAVTSQDLVKGISGEIKESLGRIDNWVVRKGRIGNHKVLLGSLKGLDEGKVGVIQDFVGDSLRGRNKSLAIASALLAEEFLGLVGSQLSLDSVSELFILILQEANTLLERFEKELLADTALLGIFLALPGVILILFYRQIIYCQQKTTINLR